jgi:hypothetical protein
MEPDATAACTLRLSEPAGGWRLGALVSCRRSSYKGRDGNKLHILTYCLRVSLAGQAEAEWYFALLSAVAGRCRPLNRTRYTRLEHPATRRVRRLVARDHSSWCCQRRINHSPDSDLCRSEIVAYVPSGCVRSITFQATVRPITRPTTTSLRKCNPAQMRDSPA